MKMEATATNTLCTIHVYRDHPDFAKHAKWWMMPMALLRSLHVADYSHLEDDLAAAVAEIELLHPGCVYIY